MEADFWLARWREEQTGFHQQRVTPLLMKYWPTLDLAPGCRVLVPLCGKSLDMIWLAEQGHEVLGIELAQQPIEQFFAENNMQATVHETAEGTHYRSGNIEVICGDIFGIGAATLGTCQGAYDRAALVALPPDMRARYATHVYSQLAPDYRGLLLTLDYEQSEMDGPPFAVNDTQVQDLYAGHSQARLIDQRAILDKEPKFKERGLTRLDTLVYRLEADR
ncbi:thiopurine S-methyltransferase [Alcaligenaceae bacterium]|nr:thiopurine S-methyltransferase [Alcaligenaceae bacterium]